MVVRSVVPDNNINWKVFESDAQILGFLYNEVELSNRNQSRLNEQYDD